MKFLSPEQIQQLIAKGVHLLCPDAILIGSEVSLERIEPGVTLYPGVRLFGERTLLRRGTVLGRATGGFFQNVCCGQEVVLDGGDYDGCVFLDGAATRSAAEIRGGTLLMENASAAHAVGLKMTILGMAVTLGSLINFCDALITGGCPEPFSFTEIGSGAVHYNFSQNSLKFGSRVGPGAPGEMFGLYPRTFIGGQTQTVGPTSVAEGSFIPAGTAVRQTVPPGMISIEEPLPARQKPYCADLLTSVVSKLEQSASLIAHYKALARYFTTARALFAKHRGDALLELLYQEATAVIWRNVEERLAWLFAKEEDGRRVDLASRLEQSMVLHVQALRSKGPVRLHLDNLREHEYLRQHAGALRENLAAPLPLSEEEAPFLEAFEQACVGFKGGADYYRLMRELPDSLKQQGAHWLTAVVQQSLEPVQRILKGAQSYVPTSEVAVQINRSSEILERHSALLRSLFRQRKLLILEDFARPDLGVINANLHWHSDLVQRAGEMLQSVAFDWPTAESVLVQIWQWLLADDKPLLLSWPALLRALPSANLRSQTLTEETIRQIVAQATYRFHGTDGLRGTIVCPNHPLSPAQAIARALHTLELTPPLFSLLARATIQAVSLLEKPVRGVAVGRDPRDIYVDQPLRAQVFYEHVLAGAQAAGQPVLDLGVTPIPNAAYTLAYFDTPQASQPVDLVLYKTASHNPASQDGLKVFVKVARQEGLYRKPMPAMESAISALMVLDCLAQTPVCAPGPYLSGEEQAQRVFSQVMTDPRNTWVDQPLKGVAFVAFDFSHGAVAYPPYREAIERCLQTIGVHQWQFVGDAPDGRNINNNESGDRVGAVHFENVSQITPDQGEPGGPFHGFPALQALWEHGEALAQSLKRGQTAWALLTDGDGDRGYALLYNPFEKSLHVLDGDQAFFCQLWDGLYQGKLGPGDTIAFTVESNTCFINAVISLIQGFGYEARFKELTPTAGAQTIYLVMTPVGDKYIAAHQCWGAESSGHTIKPTVVVTADGNTQRVVYAGNGPLGLINTIAAITHLAAAQFPKSRAKATRRPWREKIQQIISPYPTPYNCMVYVYFIIKNRWARGSALWQAVQRLLDSLRNYCNQMIWEDFAEEPNTLFCYGLNEEGKLTFSAHARPSGTENKIGFKLYGQPEMQEVFQRLSDQFFLIIAREAKDCHLSAYHQEKALLQLLASQPAGHASLAQVQSHLLSASAKADEKARLSAVIKALSPKNQSLITYDGEILGLSMRGREYLKMMNEE